MSEELTIKPEALEPLFAAWEEPTKHRARAKRGDGAETVAGRRPTQLHGGMVERIRRAVKEWRDTGYGGASDTSRYLLNHWFGRAHLVGTAEFRYYFCQREAIESLIYLHECRGIQRLSQIIDAFGGPQGETMALGITEEEDAWARYAFKMATGSGKTKVTSLAMVWSYFHSLLETDSPMARHFVVIAPNLTVYERLKEDFRPEGGGGDIFDKDPLIPVEWRGDWHLSVVLQDEASGASTGGSLYLTNIHRLYEPAKRARSGGEMPDWMGPAVSKAKALDTAAALRDRITAHPRVMVLNDEAHHLWDPDSAWNEAIRHLNDTIRKRTSGGLVSQLDFSATPKDNQANYFRHIICDTPLGEAIDAGIIKTPVIGTAGQLTTVTTDHAGHRYEMHLKLGYERWLKSKEEWKKSGKKPLMFVMCEDTLAADQITQRLNSDAAFKELNGKTFNLHTNLKGKLVKRKGSKTVEFVESEKEISDDDLKALRKLSRELDTDASPYFCIVSVLMLREGWDVRNVTTIVPLRPYTSKAGILPEQTLGRGLRRMTPPGPGGANEVVAVVEHEAFARLAQSELAQQGTFIDIVDVSKVPTTTVSIFPDPKKDHEKLKLEIPRLTAGFEVLPTLSAISEAEVREAFKRYRPLELGKAGPNIVDYEGRALITNELVEQMKVELALLATGVGAITYFEQELEYLTKVKNTHAVLGPLLKKFLEEILFKTKTTLYDPNLVPRLSDPDVREHVRATFLPLIRKKIVRDQKRLPAADPVSLSTWRPFQVSVSERRPVRASERTPFNLVPCNRSLELAMFEFLDKAKDVAALAKNAGPQCLRIDYLAEGLRPSFYTPDFIVRLTSGKYLLIETKGRADRDTAAKARAAIEWCKSASKQGAEWEYVYVPENVFQTFHGTTAAELTSACGAALSDLLHEKEDRQTLPLFAGGESVDKPQPLALGPIDEKFLAPLPARMRKASQDAIELFRFSENKQMSFSPAFNILLGSLDEVARGLVTQKLTPKMPSGPVQQRDWFEPLLDKVDGRMRKHYQDISINLRKTLVYKNGISPLGLLRNCLDYALNDKVKIAGVFESTRNAFRFDGSRKLLDDVQAINDFRNTRVAHQEKPLEKADEAKAALVRWIQGLVRLWQASQSSPRS
ncbi:MAG TPA: DEAD/DEAH box helicase family protein [Pirellulaceae bacterium]|nr:DEAD/DEAH box helicase family protein [Pirellulaceae bacterium]